jgi:uncharacterized protein (DUF736 family)
MANARLRCGELKPVPGGGELKFKGYVRLWDMLDGELQLRDHPRAKRSEDAPDFEVFYAPRNGANFTPAGAGWLKNGERASDFISMTLDNPNWHSSLNLTAFAPESTGDGWNVVWSRPRAAQQAA